MVRVVAIVLNWNGADDTLRCVQAVAAGAEKPEVLVVDNGSTDDSLNVLARATVEFETIPLPHNVGYAGGMNAGIRVALARKATHVWLLNSDAVPAPDALERLLDQRRRYAIEGSCLLSSPSPWSEDATPYPSAAMFPSGKVRIFECGGCALGVHDVDIVTGASIFVDAAWFAKAGYLDESFFHYKEEFDFVVRVREMGGKVGFVCASRVWHHRGASLHRTTPRSRYYWFRNEMLYMRKRYGSPILRVLTREPIHVRHAFRALVGLAARSSRARSRAILVGYWDGLRGVTGPTDRFAARR